MLCRGRGCHCRRHRRRGYHGGTLSECAFLRIGNGGGVCDGGGDYGYGGDGGGNGVRDHRRVCVLFVIWMI